MLVFFLILICKKIDKIVQYYSKGIKVQNAKSKGMAVYKKYKEERFCMLKVDNRAKIAEVNKCYLIGILEENKDNLPSIGYDKEPVTIMRNSDNVVSYIRVLSKEPEFIREEINSYVPNGEIYINVDSHNRGSGVYDVSYKIKNPDERAEYTKKIFNNKIIVFKPYIHAKENNFYKNVSLVKLIDMGDFVVDKNSYYISIPIVNLSNREFQANLRKKKSIKIDDGIMENAEIGYIICGNRLYGPFDGWYKSYGIINGWNHESTEDVPSIEIDYTDREFKKNVLIYNDEIAFINKKYLNKLDNMLMDYGQVLKFEDMSDIVTGPLELKDEISNTIGASGISENKQNNIVKNQEDSLLESLSIFTEQGFLNKLQETTLSKGLFYEYNDLVNFHISLKTSPLTIVAGMTGTGKTQIAKSYADILGLSQSDGTLLFLPISPSYTEPQDILGYLNTSNGLYMPSETGLVDVLVNANNNPEKIYMVIFDEMNLSQIEHWFAPFLSLLELQPCDRNLKLYGRGQTCYNAINYPPIIKVPANILFVGTVNLDETTKDLSDRVLDRANVITLERKSFADYYKKDAGMQGFLDFDGENKNEKITYPDFSSWIKQSKRIKGLTSDEIHLLDKINKLLISNNTDRGISFRMIEKLSLYLSNIPETLEGSLVFDRGYAFDLILKQRLLTKLRGSERQLDGIISATVENEDSPLYKLFNSEEAKKISNFESVKSQIKAKEKALLRYGYTS